MHHRERFDQGGYAGFDTERHVARRLSSWDEAGWRSLLVQRFDHRPATDVINLPASSDHHFWAITRGAGTMQVRSADGWRKYAIVPGLLGRATPGVPTEVRYTTSAAMSSVHVHVPADIVDRVSAQTKPGRQERPGDALLAPLLNSLAAAAGQRADPMYGDIAAEFLAAHLVTHYGRRRLDAPSGREDARVRNAVALMRDRLGDPLTLADLAAAANLSPYHFLRVFKRATGETPGRHLTRLRVREATRLLDAGGTVTAVAAQCGFSSPSHLSTAFLREFGVRPSQYRLRSQS
ncbi:AraC family transcriptional regulator [Actinoplanes campanulatus]|uniref:AraC family transcriptional regulator n=1 Tax=Actinoplanes campanulatus TaxID=113559 RepID=A0A7W5ADY5_9ACTN|nr:AraC family transcriptional regulator [Actinoplanes campanulatus]MBB3094428.1 AraC family transcriptional regulator [Actinoplanes campanulatus]GGN20948.1 AraC family transcriptional regulator [Actinoplanes campanulatus]GID35659.1 AraC family transcriptional regulator [Actinoplanes campanulatus]